MDLLTLWWELASFSQIQILRRIQGVPILLLSVRCVFVLTKYEYWTNSFCRIFVIALIVVTNYMPIADACSFQNAITFWNLLFWLRASWMGLFPDFFTLIRKVWWMPYADFIVRYVHFHVPTNYPFISCLLTFSMLLSLAMSANRFTALYFSVRINDEVGHASTQFVTFKFIGLGSVHHHLSTIYGHLLWSGQLWTSHQRGRIHPHNRCKWKNQICISKHRLERECEKLSKLTLNSHSILDWFVLDVFSSIARCCFEHSNSLKIHSTSQHEFSEKECIWVRLSPQLWYNLNQVFQKRALRCLFH